MEYRSRSTRTIRKIQTEIYDYRMLGMRVPDAFIGPRIEGQDTYPRREIESKYSNC